MSSEIWDDIEKHIESSIREVVEFHIWDILRPATLREVLKERYIAGSREHDGEWLDWRWDTFHENMREEAYDMVLYLAMNKARHDFARKYTDPDASWNQAKVANAVSVTRANLETWENPATQTETGESE
jgi:hypothetical protein